MSGLELSFCPGDVQTARFFVAGKHTFFPRNYHLTNRKQECVAAGSCQSKAASPLEL